MTYRMAKNRTFTCTANLDVATDEGHVTQTLGVRFKVVPGAEAMPVEDFLRASILHLSDIIDEDGEPVSYSTELLDAVLAEPWARVGLVKAYWTALSGNRAKN